MSLASCGCRSSQRRRKQRSVQTVVPGRCIGTLEEIVTVLAGKRKKQAEVARAPNRRQDNTHCWGIRPWRAGKNNAKRLMTTLASVYICCLLLDKSKGRFLIFIDSASAEPEK